MKDDRPVTSCVEVASCVEVVSEGRHKAVQRPATRKAWRRGVVMAGRVMKQQNL